MFNVAQSVSLKYYELRNKIRNKMNFLILIKFTFI